ncbi:MarR family winged helix-turn-helix transcriptional regulator [Streptomyces boluensis]|uniref:MarR family transcriptional regulator n=1 Tax=Streptomyces boluensis TaxID=1775135 RepID=A0A964UQQ9_9ACTN|nr:MarR family winged helix-turn-helix transcriptional regulator [Streptomyces boluensis]NBE52756.1 MarR family transcriptional regulator [Streptomyces boluensis]
MVNMVDDQMVNQVAHPGKQVEATDGSPGPARPGYELPLLLFAGFRTLGDALHAELARQGHPDVRPAHGFALQAIGPAGAAASDIARSLGISKQAAGKTVDRLASLGYVERTKDPTDARRKLVRLTARGHDVLARSAMIFNQLRTDWAAALGEDRLRTIEDGLRTVAAPGAFRLDAAGWIGGMG